MHVDRQKDALIVVDVQKDFCPGGTLAVPAGDEVVAVANRLSPVFDTVVFTRDWHPADHRSFSDEPEFKDGSWPVHCVAGSDGAEFHAGLEVPESALVVSKATDQGKEAYSGFDATQLAAKLRDKDITRAVVMGLATDYCVKATVLDALREGFDVVVVEDGCRPVDVPPGSGTKATEEMKSAGARFVTSGEVSE